MICNLKTKKEKRKQERRKKEKMKTIKPKELELEWEIVPTLQTFLMKYFHLDVVTTRSQSCKYCLLVCFGSTRVLTDLKRIYLVKRSLYIYIASGSFSPIWCGTSQTPPMQTQHPHCVPWDYGVKETNTSNGAKQTPTPKSRISSGTICNDSLQPCRYCLLWTQKAPHDFKTCVLS